MEERSGRSSVTRAAASATILPRVPEGGLQIPDACTSVLLRISSGLIRAEYRPEHSLPESAMPLTKRQREILNYLTTYTEQNGYAPSFEEIAETFKYSSLATVHEHLTNLERKGYIKRSYNESRAIEILPSEATPRALELPLLGSVAAGMPIEAIEANETFCVPETMVSRGGNHYVLRVRGNS